MSNKMQKMIVTARLTSNGIHLDLDFYPKLPESNEEYAQLSEAKKGLVAIINHIGKVNEKIVNGLVNMEKNANAPMLPLPKEVQDANSGGEAQAQLSLDVPAAKEEQDANTAG